MCEKARLIRWKDLKELLQTVRLHGVYDSNNWESCINWNQYPTIPVHDPENKKFVTLRNRHGVVNYLHEAQRRDRSSCDTFVKCEDGYIPCHSRVLMHFSPVLNELISGNIKDIGPPSNTNPIHLTFEHYGRAAMCEVLRLFYSGFCIFSYDLGYEIRDILKYLQVKNVPPVFDKYNPDNDWQKRFKSLIYLVEDSNSDLDLDDRVNDWVTDQRKTSEDIGLKTKSQNEGQVKANASGSVIKEKQFPAVANDSSSSKENKKSSKTQSKTKPPRNDDGEVAGPAPKGDSDGQPIKKKSHVQRTITPPPPVTTKKTLKTRKQRNSIRSTTSASVRSGSRTSTGREQRLKTSYEVDDDYHPEFSEIERQPESSNDEQEGGSDSSSSPYGDELHFYERNLPLKTRQRETEDDELFPPSGNAGTLTERIKLNPRNRSQSGAEKLSNDGNEKQRYPIRHRKAVTKYASDNSEKSFFSESDNEPDDSPKYLKGYKYELRCYFCLQDFKSLNELAAHSLEKCGNHLSDQYDFKTRTCYICKKNNLTALSHFGLIRHVQTCYRDIGAVVPGSPMNLDDTDDDQTSDDDRSATPCRTMGSRKRRRSERTDSESDTNKRYQRQRTVQRHAEKIDQREEELVQNDDNLNDAADSEPEDEDLQSDVSDESDMFMDQDGEVLEITEKERVPIGNPKVVMGKLSDKTVEKLMDQIKRGYSQDIPRVPGYNYVRLTPKIEPPDDILDDSVEERIRQLEIEQEESRLESERRQQARKEQKARDNAPGHSDRMRTAIIQKEKLGKEEIIKQITECSCTETHKSVLVAIKCLKSRNLQKCLICCTELLNDSPIENHLRVSHLDKNNPGKIVCPICNVSVVFGEASSHITNHLHYDHTRNQKAKEMPVPRQENPSYPTVEPAEELSNEDNAKAAAYASALNRKINIDPYSKIKQSEGRTLQKKKPPTTRTLSSRTVSSEGNSVLQISSVPATVSKEAVVKKMSPPTTTVPPPIILPQKLQAAVNVVPKTVSTALISPSTQVSTIPTTFSTNNNNNIAGPGPAKIQPNNPIPSDNFNHKPIQSLATITVPSNNASCLTGKAQHFPNRAQTSQFPGQMLATSNVTLSSSNSTIISPTSGSETPANTVLQSREPPLQDLVDIVRKDPLFNETSTISENISLPAADTSHQWTSAIIASATYQRQQSITTTPITTLNNIPIKGSTSMGMTSQMVTNSTVARIFQEKRSLKEQGSIIVAPRIIHSQFRQQPNSIQLSSNNMQSVPQTAPNNNPIRLNAVSTSSQVQEIQGDHYVGGLIPTSTPPLSKPGYINIQSMGINQQIQNLPRARYTPQNQTQIFSQNQANNNVQFFNANALLPFSNIGTQAQVKNLQFADNTQRFRGTPTMSTASISDVRQAVIQFTPSQYPVQRSPGVQQYRIHQRGANESAHPQAVLSIGVRNSNDLQLDKNQNHVNQDPAVHNIVFSRPIQQPQQTHLSLVQQQNLPIQFNNNSPPISNSPFLRQIQQPRPQSPLSIVNRQLANPSPSTSPAMPVISNIYSLATLDDHQNNNNNNISNSSTPRIFDCIRCNGKFRTPEMFDDHLCE